MHLSWQEAGTVSVLLCGYLLIVLLAARRSTWFSTPALWPTGEKGFEAGDCLGRELFYHKSDS